MHKSPRSSARALTHQPPEGSHGKHVVLDFTGYAPPVEDDGGWMLEVMRAAVARSTAREVHAHVERFDGAVSPPGFAAVVLLDESHVSAHCYSELGWLAVDCFTCGSTDPMGIADDITASLVAAMPNLVLRHRAEMPRFVHGEVVHLGA